KFRTMRIDTPKDTPTHLLDNPDQYITKVGKFLRKTSLDELPQIWNIFIGNMSIVGPRPALWNQYDLIEERDKYGANDVPPGLTGWAQINGRDELPIDVKAKLDGEYVKKMGTLMDIKCFIGTFISVAKSDGVSEGGPKKERKRGLRMRKGDIRPMKKVLITGVNSYVGNKFAEWMDNYPDEVDIDKVSLRDDKWKDMDLSVYDSILHVAGIAHVSTDPKMEELYYKVNRDLTIEVAEKAKEAGVKQFVFMSSIIVYGDSKKKEVVINQNTKPNPNNFYGRSKLEAEERIRNLESNKFKIAIIRPPMIYGKDSKGNYP